MTIKDRQLEVLRLLRVSERFVVMREDDVWFFAYRHTGPVLYSSQVAAVYAWKRFCEKTDLPF